MSSFTIVRSGRSEAISSSTGATTRQGPHQGAQKSTSTGPSASSTSASKFVSVTWVSVPAMVVSLIAYLPLYKMKGLSTVRREGPAHDAGRGSAHGDDPAFGVAHDRLVDM